MDAETNNEMPNKRKRYEILAVILTILVLASTVVFQISFEKDFVETLVMTLYFYSGVFLVFGGAAMWKEEREYFAKDEYPPFFTRFGVKVLIVGGLLFLIGSAVSIMWFWL
ncbi:MAG: hypothetical protein J7L47_02410 [Candidatus Odinarchaeota archaeon]|nr:hypothetical protein [Candidatus Odinarchaeota archaeon]